MGVANIQRSDTQNMVRMKNAADESAKVVRGNANFSGVKPVYHKISAKEAKAIMDAGEAAVVLDVRELFEYASGHIQNAVSLPSRTVAEQAAALLPDKDAKILVYCLSGGRSSVAAHQLVRLGYTDVYDFGGIVDWPYGVEIG